MDLEGWQQTRWGMIADDIIRTVGAENLRRTERAQYAGCYAEMIIPSVPVGSYSFKVVFQMDQETHRLSNVLLQYEDLTHSDPSATFRVALKLLTERFGTPDRIGTTNDLSWRFPTTTIDLV